MIPSPNLDDRTFEDIVDEAIRLIPQYCPQWTNFNKSDPGITLIELFAWMTEMVIYRLNRVPERNFLAFLNMMGIRLRPPQPADAIVQFEISEKIDQVRIPAGTRLATDSSGDQPALVFETTKELIAARNALVRCMSQHEKMFSDNTPFVGGEGGAFEVFGGARSIERFIYLGDDRLEALTEDAVLLVRFEAQGAGEREFHELLEWEYWDGSRWRELLRPSMGLDRNTAAFSGPPAFEPTTVDEIETRWIRGRLFEVPHTEEETVLDTITGRIEVLGEGVPPDSALCNAEAEIITALDLDKNFLPFGKEPDVDSTFFLASNGILGQPDSTVVIDVTLSDQTIADQPRPSHDLLLRWEYYSGRRWKILAKVAWAEGEVTSNFDVIDATSCFSETGVITFVRPKDMAPVEVNGNEAYWIRCRIEAGNYGVPGTYELSEETWVWKDENPLRPPTLKGIAFKLQEEPHPFQHCLVYNDFVYTNHSQVAATEYKPFQAFQPEMEESPTLFLGWEAPFPNESNGIYFNVVGSERKGGRAALRSFEDRSDGYIEQRVVWEYWSGKTWSPLAPRDSTENFTQPGFVEFVGPSDFRKSRRFGESLYWMRARLEMGGYDEPPRLNRIMINATHASNLTTFGDTPLGSSRGTPNQFFRFPQTPVLDGEHVVVLESERPPQPESEALIEEHGEGAIVDDEEGRGVWVRWKSVESFYDAGPRDRCYVKDFATGQISFGDGVRGMIPPKGEKNIRAWRYQIGGGQAGNVPAGAIVNMNQTLAFVTAVNNPFPAVGGCDMESVEEAKLRAPHMLKARDRAVTVDDFEWLAREASTSVARVKCLPSTSREGEVTVIIVPKAPLHAQLTERPVPTAELLKRVRNYLSERKLVGTIINVVRPAYREVSISVEIVRAETGASDRIKRNIERALRHFLHPLFGGRQGKGWRFGRSVLKVDLYQVIESVDGVEFVEKIHLFDEERGFEVEQVRLSDDQLVHLVNVNVVEKAHDRIV